MSSAHSKETGSHRCGEVQGASSSDTEGIAPSRPSAPVPRPGIVRGQARYQPSSFAF